MILAPVRKVQTAHALVLMVAAAATSTLLNLPHTHPLHYTTLPTQPTTAPNNSHSPQPDHSVTSAMQDRNSLGGGHIHRPDKALAA